jgi:acetyl esterase
MPANPVQPTRPPSKRQPSSVVVYKSAGGMDLRAHVFAPGSIDRKERRPAFLFFHPGGWQMGEPAWGYDVCHRYASSGMVAVSFQYRLSTVGGCTPVEAVLDAKSAVRWTRQHADELGIDASRILVFGISAGAHLAACAAMLPGPDEPGDNLTFSSAPEALVLQSAPLNIAIESHFAELLQGKHKPEDFSPLHHVRPGLPPFCLIHGTDDEIVPYPSVSEFVAKMQEAGNSCELHTFAGTDHFFSSRSDQRRATHLMDQFIISLGYGKRDD